ncbi:ADP-ribosylglycohydrolase family protein [Neobittarella massiliensis]|uniref:ADP-ribosylglycohydrolase family protein n=1 Tax=Neobittarella massiliensis (ex Bilen et al. 2018) TaxID=2041842 RepID=UPI000CF68B0D|nr:ADP-ribosylglycohydrolase family protein [Neobittarella massiliensis]
MAATYDQVLGCLLGAAVGDAMGAPTETRTIDMIKHDFGGFVTDLIDSPLDAYANGAPAGHVTDDFSLSYLTCWAFVKDGGITASAAHRALVEWSHLPEFCDPYVGPTTLAAIARIEAGQPQPDIGRGPLCDNLYTSNGAAMKSGPFALFTPHSLSDTIDGAITACLCTHPNVAALAGACAVSAAVWQALQPGASLDDLIETGIYGAAEGARRAQKVAKPGPAASYEKRIRLAVSLGLSHQGDFEGALRAISEVIGTGLPALESVPAVFGYIAASGGNALQAIQYGVNGGADTDTVATMIGAIMGAYRGAGAFPAHYIDLIDAVNRYDLRSLATAICAL